MLYLKVKDKNKFNLSSYANFHHTGSISGMKEHYYGKDALLVRSGSYIYNVPSSVYEEIEVFLRFNQDY